MKTLEARIKYLEGAIGVLDDWRGRVSELSLTKDPGANREHGTICTPESTGSMSPSSERTGAIDYILGLMERTAGDTFIRLRLPFTTMQ